jgi:Xaa-Pro aminopeptidase
MRRERHERVQAQLEELGLDGLLLLGSGGVSYATGSALPGADSARASLLRTVALVVRGDDAPHLFTPYPEGAPPELPADHVHPPLWPELDEGTALVRQALAEHLPAGARLAVDELTHPLRRAIGDDVTPASAVLGPVKLCKTPDELACIRAAQKINELAMVDVLAALRPGLRQTDLSAIFLQRVFELGAGWNGIDPIWQVMPHTRDAGPWTTHGDLAFPTPTTDRILREGDVVWVDTGIHHEGYASDFGRTWLVADHPRPTARQRAQFRRWREVVDAVLERCKPGVTGLELTRTAIEANGGTRPWLEHFYLAHGVGTDSAEMPMIGTDLGDEFDEQLVLEPGMVLVLEPVIWDEGASGYRAEDIVAITDDGWIPLSDHPYEPFDD